VRQCNAIVSGGKDELPMQYEYSDVDNTTRKARSKETRVLQGEVLGLLPAVLRVTYVK